MVSGVRICNVIGGSALGGVSPENYEASIRLSICLRDRGKSKGPDSGCELQPRSKPKKVELMFMKHTGRRNRGKSTSHPSFPGA